MLLHTSIPIANTMEYIENKKISPFIHKGVCKVCYVGQEPNRNNTVITKEVAIEMGRNLPGSPVVAFYSKEEKDFEGHSRDIVVENGEFKIVDMTKPYGFVPTDAKIWFQVFNDDGVDHEYLCTEVYLWTGAYPEAQRIISQGNNQSMELDDDTSNGFWANDDKTNARIFIYNEALIKKLCILGENVEPCFEGAQIKAQFSLDQDAEFKAKMLYMLTEIQETLSKGGTLPMEEKTTFEEEVMEEEVKEETSTNEEAPVEETPAEPEVFAEGHKSEDETEKKKTYNLEEVIEYTELKAQYDELSSEYEALKEQVESLKEFKLAAEREKKQNMIDSFYMLSDEDKQDVVEHIDTYSLEDIEGKLSIICVRNKVNFNLDSDEAPQGLFNLNSVSEDDSAPEWIRAVRETQNKI